ncbi:lysozyme inhibitor LprI family protein [Microvirga thermotolerans]|uniref:DUF1311 domain-containing protein n=1 Tax=Microvirga thermotolerans TaxID=2651334 RepID=A0A5P9JSI0_9HYPH|nr:lysozyme inhibitor LprI family protein [Microvirga thermotolerans]QFU15587.1 DUF1311 domain-containing protein [Microvirga thermotolerans]
MKLSSALIAVSFSLAGFNASGAALAQSLPANPCESESSTYAQSACLDKALKAADGELNAVYKKALELIDKDDMMSAEQHRNWKQALQKAQRAWVAFRDADCGEPVGYEWSQGTGMGPATLACLLQKTRIRTAELRQRYLER